MFLTFEEFHNEIRSVTRRRDDNKSCLVHELFTPHLLAELTLGLKEERAVRPSSDLYFFGERTGWVTDSTP